MIVILLCLYTRNQEFEFHFRHHVMKLCTKNNFSTILSTSVIDFILLVFENDKHNLLHIITR